MDAKKNLSVILNLAWRNIWKNKRRTILTMLIIIFGCYMIVLFNAFSVGSHDQMIDDAVGLHTGHIQIHEKGYWEKKSLSYVFKTDKKYLNDIKLLQKKKRISGFTPRINAGALLSHNDSTSLAIINGIDPAKEKTVSVMHTKIIQGRFLSSEDSTHAIVGKTLAKNLSIKIGSKIALISQGFGGRVAAEYLTVVGIFKSGNPKYDMTTVFMPFKQATETFSMENYISSLVVKVANISYVESVKNDLITLSKQRQARCSANNKTDIKCATHEVMAWDKLMPQLVQWIQMDDASLYIIDLILYLVVAFGVLNTIQMSVFERTREFGVMLAIGTTPRQVLYMVLVESVFISSIGIAIGITLGSLTSWYFNVNPIDVSQYADEMAAYGVTSVLMPAKLTYANVIATLCLSFISSILFTIFPAKRAASLNPIKAIRQL